jgi:hypothetical protein
MRDDGGNARKAVSFVEGFLSQEVKKTRSTAGSRQLESSSDRILRGDVRKEPLVHSKSHVQHTLCYESNASNRLAASARKTNKKDSKIDFHQS